MPRQRFYNLAWEDRRRLLEIATRHFAKQGFEQASLNEILAEAGISKGSYYYYFDDKEDLFATALEAAFDVLVARMPMPALDEVTLEEFWPTVERLAGEWAATVDVSSDLFQAALQLSEAQRRSPRFAQMLEKATIIYRALIEPGQRLGCIRTDLSVEALVRLLQVNDTVLDGIFLSTHTKVTAASIGEHARLVFDTFKRLLVVDPFATAPPARRNRKRHG
jgi:AcrR family transcriptional regulator